MDPEGMHLREQQSCDKKAWPQALGKDITRVTRARMALPLCSAQPLACTCSTASVEVQMKLAAPQKILPSYKDTRQALTSAAFPAA